ncbi:alpha/beta hydrolase [Myxacorys almedinensis]|uniref:Alpha/beta hydrolase fold domain-containing protein n=1 Tax=Myxacorys almedinensis A TaxID=2690445 RepID=A0A8J7Z439_9CYAN|nr:alpha/beta hydrolase [Myxacorys almedinensis]NDJ17516.1 alpha/beta hydrolase fold domain-containing protein [Myxacorys almedinensis A]
MNRLSKNLLNIRYASFFVPFLSLGGLFLASWVVLPAPTAAFLPLAVGAAEVSPWLVGLNAIAALVALKTLTSGWGSRAFLAISVVALAVSASPLIQFSEANERAAIAMKTALGEAYAAQISQTEMRPAPFVMIDAFRGIPTQATRQTTGIRVASPDGVSLTMNVYRPLLAGKNPTIVMIYGGSWQTGNPSANENFSQYMAAQGYTVIAIDYRHAPQYKFPTQITDIKTAFTFIQQHASEYDIDLNRIALVGRSAGGHLATLAGFQSQVLPIRAIVSYYSPVDLTLGYENPPSPDPLDTRAILRSFLGGTSQELPALYRQASPYEYVKPGLPPTLLIYGNRDRIVQSKYGRALYEKLNQNNNTAVFIEIPWADHAFDTVFNGVSNQLALYYVERFLAQTLQ